MFVIGSAECLRTVSDNPSALLRWGGGGEFVAKDAHILAALDGDGGLSRLCDVVASDQDITAEAGGGQTSMGVQPQRNMELPLTTTSRAPWPETSEM